MKINFLKTIKIVVFSLCLIILLNITKSAFAVTSLFIERGQTVNFPFRVFCNASDGLEKPVEGQKVYLFKQEGYWGGLLNGVWISTGESIVNPTEYVAQSDSAGAGSLTFSVVDTLFWGEYYIGFEEPFKMLRTAMYLNELQASYRGRLTDSSGVEEFFYGKPGSSISFDSSKREYKFNMGQCSGIEKPVEQPKDLQQELYNECAQVITAETPPQGYCAEFAKSCIEKSGEKDSCIKQGKQRGLDLRDLIIYCNSFMADEGRTTTPQQGACFYKVIDCMQKDGEKAACKAAGKQAADSINPPTPAQGPDDQKYIEDLKGYFQTAAHGACAGTDPDWTVLYPDYKPTDVERCTSKAVACFNPLVADAIAKSTLSRDWGFCISIAIKLEINKQNSPTVTPPESGGTGDTPGGDNTNTNPDNGLTAPVNPPAEETQPENKEVPTKIVAHIFGQDSGTIAGIDMNGGGQISVGARVTPEDAETCIPGEVSFALQKINDENGRDILNQNERTMEVTKERVEKKAGEPAVDGVFVNCQSYYAKLKGPGTYALSASFAGGEFEGKNYKPSSVYPAVAVVIKGTEAQIQTRSKVEVKTQSGGMQTKAATSFITSRSPSKRMTDQKTAWAKLFAKNKAKNVAGIRAENIEGRGLVVSQENSQDRLVLIPATTMADGTLDTTRIPTVHFTATEVFNNGSSSVLLDDANYPNGEPRVLSEQDLGDLSQVNHLEITASYDDPGSEYSSSSGDLRIEVAQKQVEENTYVSLSSNPAPENILAGEETVTITASTNKPVDNPVFEVVHNGGNERITAVGLSSNCADGNGSCEYVMELYQPDGDYSINFNNKGVEAPLPLTFTTKIPEASGESNLLSQEILYQGQSYPMGVTLDLAEGENVIQRISHYADKDVPESFTVLVVRSTSTPVSQIKWYCEGDTIIEEENGNTKVNRDCAAEGLKCHLIDTEGYSSDADCYNPGEPNSTLIPTPVEPTPTEELGWYCEGTMIKQNRNGEISDYYDCTGEGKTCVPKYDTPGYPKDAECFAAQSNPEPPKEQPQPSQLEWYCEGDMIKQNENGNIINYYNCSDNGQKCRGIDTPGYESDAECYSPDAPKEQPSLSWFCEGTMIKQNENGNITDYYDCSEDSQTCVPKYDTPGYPVDAQCQ